MFTKRRRFVFFFLFKCSGFLKIYSSHCLTNPFSSAVHRRLTALPSSGGPHSDWVMPSAIQATSCNRRASSTHYPGECHQAIGGLKESCVITSQGKKGTSYVNRNESQAPPYQKVPCIFYRTANSGGAVQGTYYWYVVLSKQSSELGYHHRNQYY